VRTEKMGVPQVKTYDDIVKLGKESRRAALRALKTNVLLLGDGNPRVRGGGFGRGDGYPDLNADRYVLDALRSELAAFREGAGKDMDILVDLNWNFKTEGFLRRARTMEPYELFWVEIDTRDPKALPMSAIAPPFRSLPANACSDAAITGPSSSTLRWTSPSSTFRGTACPNRSRSRRWPTRTRST
jgi:hypothetical protein